VIEQFQEPLDSGHYLFCVRPSCVNVEVAKGTVTVNIKLREGPPSFFVSEDATRAPVEDFGFSVGF